MPIPAQNVAFSVQVSERVAVARPMARDLQAVYPTARNAVALAPVVTVSEEPVA